MDSGVSKLGKFKVSSSLHSQPERLFVYGSPKVGKSSWASCAPRAFMIDLDRGAAHVDIAHNDEPIETWRSLLEMVKLLGEESHPYETVILDTLDRAEALSWAHACEFVGTGSKNRKSVTSIEEVAGGYGKGFSVSYEQMRALWGLLEVCWRKKNMRIIVLAHSKVETFKNPSGPDYDRYVPKVHKDIAKLFFEVADAAMFATRNVIVKQGVFGGDKRYHAMGGESRVLYTQEAATHLAGNRYGLPERISLDWDEFVGHVAKGHSPALLEATIRDKARRLADPAVTAVLDERLRDAKGDLRKLLTLMGRLDTRLDKATETKVAEEEKREAAVAETPPAAPSEVPAGTPTDETTN